MNLNEALALMGEKPQAWRVRFERIKRNGAVVTDFFPATNEEPFRNQAEAEAAARKFASVGLARIRNIRAAADDVPDREFPEGSIVFAYARVSTFKQDAEMHVQHEAMARYIRERLIPAGAQWNGQFYSEVVTSAVPFDARPAGWAVCQRLQRGDHFVVHKLDRAFRSSVNCMQMVQRWRNLGVHLHFLNLGADTTTLAGRVLLSSYATFAELEREFIMMRTKETVQSRKGRGLPVGPVPYFKRRGRDGKYHYDADQLRQIDEIYRWRFTDGWTWNAIARCLLLRGQKTQKGGEWHPNNLKKACDHYQGLINAEHPALLRLGLIKPTSIKEWNQDVKPDLVIPPAEREQPARV